MIQKQKLNILLPLLILMMGAQSCTFDTNAIRGDGNVLTREKNLDSFTEIDASGVFKIFLLEGENPHIRIETDENIHEYISYEVKRSTLKLKMESNQIYRPTRLDVYVTVNDLGQIRLSGATSLEADHVLVSPEFSLHLSGAGDIDLEVETEKLTTHVSGAGSLKIKGYTYMHDITLSGAASLKCVDLITHITHIKLSGAGSANVYASEELNASISGVGSIRYAGEPRSTNISRSGVGSIRPI
ncbi:MAG: DUF2807 domain-containing protein [Bacteroidetes bacterium]|nr:MAG: DUF2807 domain-containing protein [Bacteroidota bacterium]